MLLGAFTFLSHLLCNCMRPCRKTPPGSDLLGLALFSAVLRVSAHVTSIPICLSLTYGRMTRIQSQADQEQLDIVSAFGVLLVCAKIGYGQLFRHSGFPGEWGG